MHSVEIINRYREARARLWPQEPKKLVRLPVAPPLEVKEAKKPKPAPEPERQRQTVHRDVGFDWRKAFSEICLRYGVSPILVMDGTKTWPCVLVRAELANILRSRGWSTPQIGRVLKRDHSSVVHLLQKYSWGSPALDGLRTRHECFMNDTAERGAAHDKAR